MMHTNCYRAATAVTAICLLMAAASPVAAVNPANWNFFVETFGGDVQWDSPTNVDGGFPFYSVDFEVTQLEAQFAGGAWGNLFAFGVDPNDYKGSAVVPGPLPVGILADQITNDDNGSITMIDVGLGVDGAGQGHLSLSNVQLGTFNGIPVTGFRMGGSLNVAGIPEPASLALLGVGALVLAAGTQRRRL